MLKRLAAALSAAAFLLAFDTPHSSGDLVLSIDAAADMAVFFETDSGLASASDRITWQFGPGGATSNDLGGFTVSPSATVDTFAVNDTSVIVSAFWLSDPGGITVSGTGVPFSYATLTSTQKDVLEGLVGSSIPLVEGSRFSSIRVVPEPSAFLYGGLIASIVGCGAWARRRVG